jgi:UDP-N-acetylmuramyl pentapeptide phosphotransferase/UDP-N-acetylglucosamine-1-phosphate transferase
MSLIGLILVLVLVGVVLYLINTLIPMDSKVKLLLNIVVIIVLILFVLSAFGVLDDLRAVRVPKV